MQDNTREELRSNIMMHSPQKTLDRRKLSRGFILIEGHAYGQNSIR